MMPTSLHPNECGAFPSYALASARQYIDGAPDESTTTPARGLRARPAEHHTASAYAPPPQHLFHGDAFKLLSPTQQATPRTFWELYSVATLSTYPRRCVGVSPRTGAGCSRYYLPGARCSGLRIALLRYSTQTLANCRPVAGSPAYGIWVHTRAPRQNTSEIQCQTLSDGPSSP